MIVLLALNFALFPLFALESTPNVPTVVEMTAEQIVERINTRPDGETLDQKLRLEILDAKGRGRTNVIRGLRRDFGAERRSRMTFEQPRLLGGTGFLSVDYPDARQDDQWIYLTSDRRTRRISSSGRGDSFFGSEFTFEDVKSGSRINAHEFFWERTDDQEIAGSRMLVLDYRPRTDELVADLGYGRARMFVDPVHWLPVRLEFWDRNDNPAKRIEVAEAREVEGIWTPHLFEAVNLKNRRASRIFIEDVDYDSGLDAALFHRDQLGRAIRSVRSADKEH